MGASFNTQVSFVIFIYTYYKSKEGPLLKTNTQKSTIKVVASIICIPKIKFFFHPYRNIYMCIYDFIFHFYEQCLSEHVYTSVFPALS